MLFCGSLNVTNKNTFFYISHAVDQWMILGDRDYTLIGIIAMPMKPKFDKYWGYSRKDRELCSFMVN